MHSNHSFKSEKTLLKETLPINRGERKVNYEIVEIQPFCGVQATVYSILPEGESETLFDRFINENQSKHKDEVKDIIKRLSQIGHTTGAREGFFKQEGDSKFRSKYGDHVCALYDDPDKKLRLYCIRLGKFAVILGGGGPKSKSTIKWQEDEKLTEEVTRIMAYAACIFEQLDNRDIYWSEDGTALEGELKNYEDE